MGAVALLARKVNEIVVDQIQRAGRETRERILHFAETANATDPVSGMLSNSAKGLRAADPFGITPLTPAAAAMEELAKVITTVEAAFLKLRDTLATVNGEVAAARAITDIRLLETRLRRGEAIGRDVAATEMERGEAVVILEEIKTTFLKQVAPVLREAQGLLTDLLELWQPVARFFIEVPLSLFLSVLQAILMMSRTVVKIQQSITRWIPFLGFLRKEDKEPTDPLREIEDFLDPDLARSRLDLPPSRRRP